MPTDCFYHVPSIKKWYIHMIITNIWSTQISTHQWWRYRTAPMMCNWTAGDWSDFPVRSWLIQYWSMAETGPMCRPNQIGCDFFWRKNAINLFDWKSHEQTCANYNEREGKNQQLNQIHLFLQWHHAHQVPWGCPFLAMEQGVGLSVFWWDG